MGSLVEWSRRSGAAPARAAVLAACSRCRVRGCARSARRCEHDPSRDRRRSWRGASCAGPTSVRGLASSALDAVPHAIFVVDALRPGRPNVLRQRRVLRAHRLRCARSRRRRLRCARDLRRPGGRRRARRPRRSCHGQARACPAPRRHHVSGQARAAPSCRATTAAAISSACSRASRPASARPIAAGDAARCSRQRRRGAHGRVPVVAHPRAALAAECVRHVARRPRARSAAGQAHEGRRSDQTQPRAANAARQRPQRCRQGLVGRPRDAPRASRSRRAAQARPRRLAIARDRQATRVSPPSSSSTRRPSTAIPSGCFRL